jgi:hypothetical protein
MAMPSGRIHVIDMGEGTSDYYFSESQQNQGNETCQGETLFEALLCEQNVQLKIMFEYIT